MLKNLAPFLVLAAFCYVGYGYLDLDTRIRTQGNQSIAADAQLRSENFKLGEKVSGLKLTLADLAESIGPYVERSALTDTAQTKAIDDINNRIELIIMALDELDERTKPAPPQRPR